MKLSIAAASGLLATGALALPHLDVKRADSSELYTATGLASFTGGPATRAVFTSPAGGQATPVFTTPAGGQATAVFTSPLYTATVEATRPVFTTPAGGYYTATVIASLYNPDPTPTPGAGKPALPNTDRLIYWPFEDAKGRNFYVYCEPGKKINTRALQARGGPFICGKVYEKKK